MRLEGAFMILCSKKIHFHHFKISHLLLGEGAVHHPADGSPEADDLHVLEETGGITENFGAHVPFENKKRSKTENTATK